MGSTFRQSNDTLHTTFDLIKIADGRIHKDNQLSK